MIDIFEYIKRQLEYCETATNIEKYNVDTYSKDNMTDEQMSGYYRGRIEMLYAIKHYLEVGNIVLPQADVKKSVCEHKTEDIVGIDDIYGKCKCGKIIMGYK